jgi:GNAT superfamily N-acetyltransferase
MIVVRQAQASDAEAIHRLLTDAARWVDALGAVMWDQGELAFTAVAADVAAGQFHIADADGIPAGAIRFQTDDLLFWPDIPQHDSAFVHRLVVARAFKGSGVSAMLLQWAVGHARSLGKSWLRLDCDDDRVKLKALYERFGFRFHSHAQVGPYYVSRYEYPLAGR